MEKSIRIQGTIIENNVEYLDHMGTDLDVVNAARVSFNKEVSQFTDRDEKLIAYLAKNGHWTPFSQCFMKFRITMPIFTARQMVRHTVGVTINEVSRRYIDTPPDYYFVDGWRERAENKKQGSKETSIAKEAQAFEEYYDVLEYCDKAYSNLLAMGVCPEQARMVLPLASMTTWIYSGSLYAFARITKLRVHEHAQHEVRLIGEGISNHAQKYFPISWKYLVIEANK
jgi:thymidylate synthase (FAD)